MVENATTLKRQATKLLKELREEKKPILIIEHDIPSAYLINVDHFEYLKPAVGAEKPSLLRNGSGEVST